MRLYAGGLKAKFYGYRNTAKYYWFINNIDILSGSDRSELNCRICTYKVNSIFRVLVSEKTLFFRYYVGV